VPVQAVGGQGLEADKGHLSELWQVPASEILWFSNRDTVVTELDTTRSREMGALPEIKWLYRPAGSPEAASQMCQGRSNCRAVRIEGAAAEAARLGSQIVVLGVWPANMPIDLNTVLKNARAVRPTIFLTARAVPGIVPGTIVMFATGVGAANELEDLCDAFDMCGWFRP
jgi:hypothetical protein